jgi:hypothetical protein
MRGVEPSQTCLAVCVGVEEFEGQWHTQVSASAVIKNQSRQDFRNA